MYAIPDNSGYYFLGSFSAKYLNLCRYLHGQSSIQCQTITNFDNGVFSTFRISSDRFYFSGFSYNNISYYTMIDITFGTSQINWGVSMKCLSCNEFLPKFHGAALSSDKSKIYVIIPLGKVTQTISSTNSSTLTLDLDLYFVTLSETTGSVVGSIYMTNNGGYYVLGATVSGDYVVAPFLAATSGASTFLMLFNTATS